MSTAIKVLEITTGGRPKAHAAASQKLTMAQFVAGGSGSPTAEVKLQVSPAGGEADAQILFQVDGSIQAKKDGTLTLGASGKLATFSGNVQIDGNITVTGTQTVVSTVTAEGNTVIGNLATADTLSIVSRLVSDIDPDGDTRSLGSTARRFLNLYVADQSSGSGIKLGNDQDMVIAYTTSGEKGKITFVDSAVGVAGRGFDTSAGAGGAASGAVAGAGGVRNDFAGKGGIAAGGFGAGPGGAGLWLGGTGGAAIAGAGNVSAGGGVGTFGGGEGGVAAGTNPGAVGGDGIFRGGTGGASTGAGGSVGGNGAKASLLGGTGGAAGGSGTQGNGGDAEIQGGLGLTVGAVNIATVNASALNIGKSGLQAAVAGSMNVAQDFSVATSKFSVASATGNTAVEGTLRLAEQGSAPAFVANKGFVYSKDVAGIAELFYIGDSGAAVQITSNGNINTGSISFPMQQAYDDGNIVALTNGRDLVFKTRTAATAAAVKIQNAAGAVDFLVADEANLRLDLGAATHKIRTMGHVEPMGTNSIDIGTASLAYREVFTRKVTSDGSLLLVSAASSDLTIDSGRDLILELTGSRNTAAKFAVGGTNYLTFDTTGTKMIAGQVLEMGANLTFDAQNRQFNGIEVQDLYSAVQTHTSGGVTAAKIVFFDSADSKVKHADADVYAQSVGAYGVAMATVADASQVRVATGHGIAVAGFSGLTVGAIYYLSQTAGDITTTAPTAAGASVVRVGVAKSATVLMFAPQFLFEN